MKIKLLTISIFLGIFFFSCNKDKPELPVFTLKEYDAEKVTKTNSMKIYMHYMPWFETPESSDNQQWGSHWTMATKNPNNWVTTEKREIASHFYPLIGPYASGDAKVIEYHLLLMKYSGIDGVLIDWYGASNINDYKKNRENSEALIEALEKVGMEYAIVYEDRTITAQYNADANVDKIGAAQVDMVYIKNTYFNDSHYIKINDKPLLLLFGPEEFQIAQNWTDILSVLTTKPCFLTLNGTSSKTGNNSQGEYIWVDNNSLDSKYATQNNFEVFFGGAYPGFKDFYKEGGWGDNLPILIAHNNGTVFQENLNKAQNAGVDYLQLITWNDYGEGTMIEPTLEFGYTFLKQIQDFTGVSYTQTELEAIKKLYDLRIKYADNQENQKKLDQAFYYLISLQFDLANDILNSL